MYPSSTSSSSCQSHNSTISQTALTRFASAPGSLLRTAVDALIAPLPLPLPTPPHYFTGDSSDSASASKLNNSDPKDHHHHHPHHHHHKGTGSASGGGGLQRSYGLQEAFGGGSSSSSSSSSSPSSSLLRQRSSPAGFLNHLASSAHLHDNTTNAGFTITRGSGHGHGHGHGVARLKSQLSFTGQDSLMTQISEVSDNNVVDASTSDHRSTHPSITSSSFSMDPWDTSNSIVFSAPPPNKRSKSATIDGDILNCLSALDSQFSLPQTSLEMATMDKLMHIPEDSVPCKIRAKRGCATHPRSIAERERRTRISGKLKKLQELVPNMDKQTSYADMLDLAVQHIKGLQTQVQKLHKELEDCTCGCKPST